MIGTCDHCGEYCSELGVNAVEALLDEGGGDEEDEGAFDDLVAWHCGLVEARLQCSGGNAELPGFTHVGPWHGPDGERLETCDNCADDSEMSIGPWSAWLDHDLCLTCWGRVAGGAVLLRRLGDRAAGRPGGDPWTGAAPLDAATPAATHPADRDAVEAAFRAYLGEAMLPIRWVGSPGEVARALVAANDAAETPLRMDADEGPPPWSIWKADEALVTTLVQDDAEGAEPDVAVIAAGRSWAAIARALAVAIVAADPDVFADDHTLVQEAMADAGQLDIRTPAYASLHPSGPDDHAGAALVDLLVALGRSTGPLVVLSDEIVAAERPLLLALDDAGRPHAEHGPAIAYGDGFRVHAWHGRVVPEWVISEPDRITPDTIDEEPNVEVRWAMVERFGFERLIREGGAELVHEDETGRLWRRRVGTARDRRSWTEPICMVEVINATPEPDGTRRTYFLRVPPSMATAREAVAWTFGMEGREYAPAIET